MEKEEENLKNFNNIDNLNNLIISESNYSCEYFDTDYINQKNQHSKKLYNLEEKEQEIYDNQELLSKKMINLISKNTSKFNYKFNRLQKRGEFYHYYYNNYNDKIKSMFNNYNANYNRSILELVSDFNKNWVFPQSNNFNLNSKTFQKKCDIRPCIKNNSNRAKSKYNNSTKSKSCSKLIKTYRNNINNSAIINLKTHFNNNNYISVNNRINNKYKTERKTRYNSAVKITNINPKKSAITSLRNSNFSLFEENKALYMNSFFGDKNNKKINTNKEFYSTKISFRNYRNNNKDSIMNMNESKSFKKNDSQFNFYKYSTNDKKFIIK